MVDPGGGGLPSAARAALSACGSPGRAWNPSAMMFPWASRMTAPTRGGGWGRAWTERAMARRIASSVRASTLKRLPPSTGATVDLVGGASLLLGELLHLHGHGRSLPLGLDLPVGVAGDPEGDRADGNGVALTAAVHDLDVAAQGVGGVVVVEDAVVEPLDDLLAVRLGHLGVDDGDEVVASDVADEGVALTDGVGGVLEAAAAEADHLVAPHEAVVVVERLEIVEVAVHEGEGLPGGDAILDLLGDPEVPGKAGEGRQVAGGLGAPQHGLHASDQLRDVEGLRDVVVGAELQPSHP